MILINITDNILTTDMEQTMVLAINKLRDWKVSNLLTQAALAESLGVSQPYISMLFCGRTRNVSDDVKKKINKLTSGSIKISDWFD